MSSNYYPQMSAFAGFGEFLTQDGSGFEIVNGPVFFSSSMPNGLRGSIVDYTAIDQAKRDGRLATLTTDLATFEDPTSSSLGNIPFEKPLTDMEGWIDIRGFVRLSILVFLESGATGATFAVEVKRGSHDPNPQELVAPTAVVPNSDVLLFSDSCEYFSHVRLVVTGAPSPGNNNFGLVNILGK